MRLLLMAALTLSACYSTGSRRTPFAKSSWSHIDDARYAIGVMTTFTRDSTRPSLPNTSVARGRPLQIVIWYPAVSAGTDRTTLRRYVELSAGLLGPDSSTAERRRRVMSDFVREPLANGITAARLDALLDSPMAAMVNAPHAAGQFPLVVFLHSTPWGASAMSEYLAGQGFVVAAIESKGATDVAYRLSIENLDAMVLDAAFTVRTMRSASYVNDRLGIVGMSNGSIGALALELSGILPQAVVSLDGGIGERAGGTYLAQRTGGELRKLTVPVMHLYTPDNSFLDFQYLRSYEAASRTLIKVGHLRHGDFLTVALIERALPGAFGAAPAEAAIGFEFVNRYAKRFLQAHLGNDRKATAFLSNSASVNGAPPGLLDIERLPRTGRSN